MRILIVDDDALLLQQLARAMEKLFDSVETASDGEKALEALAANPVDIIVLDIMMPKMDGITFLRTIREKGCDVLVLMLSAKGDTEDRVTGLNLGADDYLPKPFSLDELVARVRSLLRRNGGQADNVLRVGDIVLDTVAHNVTRAGAPLSLTPREFAILEFLLYNKNRVVSRFSLAEHVWSDDFDPFSMSNFMDVHIKNLRHKIGDNARVHIIETVRGVGYTIKDR